MDNSKVLGFGFWSDLKIAKLNSSYHLTNKTSYTTSYQKNPAIQPATYMYLNEGSLSTDYLSTFIESDKHVPGHTC